MRGRSVAVGVGVAVFITALALPMAPAVAATEPTYYLPAPQGTALAVVQGNHPRFQRSDGRGANERYAFDFAAAESPKRFPVLAARGGTVRAVRSGVRGGNCAEPLDGPRPACARNTNFVLIDHGDGTSGLYSHLKRGDPPVRRGQVVSAGQRIGSAGSSGWTDGIGLQFQVQETPTWDTVGDPGWYVTRSLPVTFADEDVATQRSDLIPRTDDLLISGNPGPAFRPFRLRRRPTELPAAVPFEPGAERTISNAYDAGSPDGYGLHFAPAPEDAAIDPSAPVSSSDETSAEDATVTVGTTVRPLFGGELAFAGCASGESAALGPTVVISREIDGREYLGVLAHLSEIDASLLSPDPEAPPQVIGPNEVVGRYGGAPMIACLGADPEASELFATILRGATVSAEGEISGGTPVSPEPLVGSRGYEGLTWWDGPVSAETLSERQGNPRARWNRRSTANGARVQFGDEVRLIARVRDSVDIAEVRFRAWYPRWPRVVPSGALESFTPGGTWRELAVCTPLDSRGGCTWDGTNRNALVRLTWDPTATETADIEAWLPRARTAMTRSIDRCVPVSLAVEVIDTAGHAYSLTERLPRSNRCDSRAAERAEGSRVVYLDPLVPPPAPTPRGNPRASEDRSLPPVRGQDDGAIRWFDNSDNEDGFRIYARRSWFEADCSVTDGPWQVVRELPADRQRYRPQHRQVVRSIEVPEIENVPGTMVRVQYAVAAYNRAGRSTIVPVAIFSAPDNICDLGLEPPPDL